MIQPDMSGEVERLKKIIKKLTEKNKEKDKQITILLEKISNLEKKNEQL